MQITVNPFYAARKSRNLHFQVEAAAPKYAKLPRAPKNASPVPSLTSLYHNEAAGE
jgi:hypothetical protein